MIAKLEEKKYGLENKPKEIGKQNYIFKAKLGALK